MAAVKNDHSGSAQQSSSSSIVLNFASVVVSSEFMPDTNARLTRLLAEGIKLSQRMLNKKSRVIDFLYNISTGAYETISNSRLSTLPDLEVEKIMTSEGPSNKFDIINDIIAKIHIYSVHPNEHGTLDNFHSHIYAGCRTRDGKTTIYLNSIIFDASNEHDNTCVVFLAMVLAHELAHGVKRVTRSVATPKRSFFLERGQLPWKKRYDGGCALEHILINSECHLSDDNKFQVFLVTVAGEKCLIARVVIDMVVQKEDFDILRQIAESTEGEILSFDMKLGFTTFTSTKPLGEYQFSDNEEGNNENEINDLSPMRTKKKFRYLDPMAPLSFEKCIEFDD